MTPVYNGPQSGDFFITCSVSSTNMNNVTILQNGVPVSAEFFSLNLIQYECNGQCKYDAEQVTQLDIQWKATEKIFSCDTIKSYDGELPLTRLFLLSKY